VTDVLVLGLGPAGAAAAAEAAQRGCRVVALDRKREAGVPVQCAELVPAMLEVDGTAVQRIDAMATFVEDDDADVQADFPGHMLDRAAFDAQLVTQARAAGVQIRFGALVKRIALDGTVELAGGEKIRARVIIGADGPRSRAGAAIGSVNDELVETRQITVPLKAPYAATDIFLSADIPGGYGWLFPKGDAANLGAGVEPAHKARLKPIVDRLHAGLGARVGRKVLATTGGAIPVGGMLECWGLLGETLVLLAGDAAGLANPVTGAGIAAAVHSGRHAAEEAARHAPQDYHEDFRDGLGPPRGRAGRRRGGVLTEIQTKSEERRGWSA
jgi:geranylgeranyl reductase family protein